MNVFIMFLHVFFLLFTTFSHIYDNKLLERCNSSLRWTVDIKRSYSVEDDCNLYVHHYR